MAHVECQESIKFAHDLRCTDGHKVFSQLGPGCTIGYPSDLRLLQVGAIGLFRL